MQSQRDPDRYPTTWPALIAWIIDAGTKSWAKLLQVATLIAIITLAIWLATSTIR
jgi:hypothetical protein